MNIVQCIKQWNGPCDVEWYGNYIVGVGVGVNMQGNKFHSFKIFFLWEKFRCMLSNPYPKKIM